MEQDELKELQKRVLRTKKDLRKWEGIFSQKHGRPATIDDIKARPNIEKFYKKYNHLKRDLKKAMEANQMEDVSSQLSSCPVFADSQDAASTTSSPSSSQQRRNSVEYIKSPSSSGTRVNQYFHHENREDRLKVRRLSEVEGLKMAIATSSSTTTIASPYGNRVLAEDEAFWLELTPTSASQPLPSVHHEQVASPTSPSSSTQPPRLKLGGSQSKKSQRISKSNPFHRRQRLAQQQQSKQIVEAEEQAQLHSQPQRQPSLMPFSQQAASQMDISDDENDDMNGIQVVNHEENPFRNYDPSLFHWDDPSFSVGPGFFGSAKACTSYMVPILNEPSRRDRILRKIEKGTLGELTEENQAIEDELAEEIRQFINLHNINNPHSLEAALQPIDDNLLNTPDYVYKKRPLQKRQTKLFKMKFVETR
ncbi:Pre-mRNA-splicing factor 18 [Mucor velutinosus]|uniref:Pre-mRNA-splicing factor 18 n=1 Tax=Mucor velutinosus TaxID=708070 RepID=A0AAN7HUE4_9FUNG|nr:Pre-mRNA-splicing factor 18 [Mucor velutinosus]